uniref:Uncharacterized protein n=1 Tax=Solanum tuberosum TaxID=4113 RepID=M1AP62_SOLTU
MYPRVIHMYLEYIDCLAYLSPISLISPAVSVFQNVSGIKYACSLSPLTISLASLLLQVACMCILQCIR